MGDNYLSSNNETFPINVPELKQQACVIIQF